MLWGLVERSGSSCSALLEAQVRGALWEFVERSGGSWSALQAMVMEARSFISNARLRPPPCRVEKVVPNRHFVIYSYVLNDSQIFNPFAGDNKYAHRASDVKNPLYCRSAEWKCVYFHWFCACGMRSSLVLEGLHANNAFFRQSGNLECVFCSTALSRGIHKKGPQALESARTHANASTVANTCVYIYIYKYTLFLNSSIPTRRADAVSASGVH